MPCSHSIKEAILDKPDEVHAKYSPSKLSRILACTASVGACEGIEDQQSAPAAEGEMLHEMTAQCINPKTLTIDYSLVRTFDIDDEQATAIEDALKYLEVLILSRGDNDLELLIETRVFLEAYSPFLEDVHGTADIILIDRTAKIVFVIDWKYGKGVPVDSFNNIQLMTYALGALIYVIGPMLAHQGYKVEVHIVQPRINNSSHWVVPDEDLTAYLEQLIAALWNIEQGLVSFSPGENQCRWCLAATPHQKGFSPCEARLQWQLGQAKSVFAAIAELPDVTDERLVEVSKTFPALQRAMKQIDAYLYAKLLASVEVPGKKLVAGRNSRKWIDESKVILWFDENVDDPEALWKTQLKTPAQAEKISKAVKNSPEFHKLVKKIPGKLTMADASDKRAGITITEDAKEKFAEFI
jgi:hypothetical protein